MNMSVDRVVKSCGQIEVDVTFGADTFRLTAHAAQLLGSALLEASEPAELSELVAHV